MTTWPKRSCSDKPKSVRLFLLRTSILTPAERTIVGRRDRRERRQGDVGAARSRNLSLVPLDDRREWYRYHHLFADVLLARLMDEQPDLVPELHRRASAWYEQHGEPPEAIRHALRPGTWSTRPT